MATTQIDIDYSEPGGYSDWEYRTRKKWEERKVGRQLIMCIYCSRLNDLEEGLDCEGCGGNLPMPMSEPLQQRQPYVHPGGVPPGISSASVMMMTTSALTFRGENSSW